MGADDQNREVTRLSSKKGNLFLNANQHLMVVGLNSRFDMIWKLFGF
jgi:hypothetical protein